MKSYIGLLAFMLIVASFISCKGEAEQMKYFNNSLQNDDIKLLSKQLQQELYDTLNNWIYVKDYKMVQVFRTEKWQIDDAAFINPEQNKAILLILKQDMEKYITVPTTELGAPEDTVPTSLDYVELMFANKEKDGWHFYSQSMESLSVFRSEEDRKNFIPTTFEDLSFIGRRYVLRAYFKRGTCTYNPKFFDIWNVDMLKQMHLILINGGNVPHVAF